MTQEELKNKINKIEYGKFFKIEGHLAFFIKLKNESNEDELFIINDASEDFEIVNLYSFIEYEGENEYKLDFSREIKYIKGRLIIFLLKSLLETRGFTLDGNSYKKQQFIIDLDILPGKLFFGIKLDLDFLFGNEDTLKDIPYSTDCFRINVEILQEITRGIRYRGMTGSLYSIVLPYTDENMEFYIEFKKTQYKYLTKEDYNEFKIK